MRGESNPSRIIRNEERIGPTKTAVGSTRISLCQRATVGLVAATAIIVVWFTDQNTLEESVPVRVVRGEPGRRMETMVLSADGTKMATTNCDGSVSLREARCGWRIEPSLKIPGYRRSVSFSPDGRFLACAGPLAGVTLHDLESDRQERTLPVPLEDPWIVAFAPDGRTLAVATMRDGRVLFWNLAEGRVSRRLHAPGPVVNLAFSPDGRFLVTGGREPDFTMNLWDLNTGRCRCRLAGSVGFVKALAFSKAGDRLASAGVCEGGARLWDVRSGTLGRVIEGHALGTTGLSFSPDGSTLATAGNDGVVRLWDVSTGRQVTVLDSEATALVGVAYSPDGRWIAAGARDDDHLRIWELSQARPDHVTTASHR